MNASCVMAVCHGSNSDCILSGYLVLLTTPRIAILISRRSAQLNAAGLLTRASAVALPTLHVFPVGAVPAIFS